MRPLKETNFSWLGQKTVGKVRDIYERESDFVFITTDRHSSFDRIIAHIPHKGAVLNLLSNFWFEKTKHIVPNHVISVPDQNVTVGKKCKPLPIECVVRGYITGTTNTSLWALYKDGKRDFGNFTLPEGVQKNQKLDEPVFTPSTKSDEHDVTVSPQEIETMGLLTQEQVQQVETYSLELFALGSEYAKKQGIILVDTKYEFGFDEAGTITLIDEIHTPDSSRYWYLDSYEERFKAQKEPEYFDKEFLRLWFKENSDPYNDTTLPEAPDDMIKELSARYITIYETLTQTEFSIFEGDALARIEKNLKTL